MILLIDNYDSFVFNLARYLRELGHNTKVVRNDALTIQEVQDLSPEAIVISPGPCTPAEAGHSVELVQKLHGKIPIFGVCLGHQVIAAALGAAVVRATEPVHGRTSMVSHLETSLFGGLSNPFRATRYHSLIVEEGTLPDSLTVTARTEDGTVMALESPQLRLASVQFHPESILTAHGHRLLKNFLGSVEVEPTEASAVQETPPENVNQRALFAMCPESDWRQSDSGQGPLHW